jgi:CRP-like cAMP-binding protein
MMNRKNLERLKIQSYKLASTAHKFATEMEQLIPVEVKHFPKNTFLISKNDLCSHIFFIRKGCVRSFIYDADFNEITIWFTFEGQAVVSIPSYVLELPSDVMIQALEDVEVVIITKEQLNQMYAMRSDTHHLVRSYMENYLTHLSMRMIALQSTLAESRYHELLKEYPNIFQRIPLRHIASFIGVKTETLSRIRANYKKRQP